MSAQVISVRLALPDDVPAGSQIKGILEIRNESGEAVELVSPHCNGALNIVVLDSYWNAVRANSLGKANIAHQGFELAPGKTARFELIDLTFATGTSRSNYRLRPGIYHVLAIYHPGTSRRPDQSSYPTAVASNVAKLSVD